MVANHDKKLLENTVDTNIKGIGRILKSTVIYGPNAGGKSNLIKALFFMQNFVLGSFKNSSPNSPINNQPYLFSKDRSESSTEFEINILRDRVRYNYKFKINSERVLSEELLVFKNSKPQTWFSRFYNSENGKDEYKLYSDYLKGDKKTWQNSTRPNSLFLSTAVALNVVELNALYYYFYEELIILNENTGLNLNFTNLYWETMGKKSEIVNFLKSSGISFEDLEYEKINFDKLKNTFEETGVEQLNINNENSQFQIYFKHLFPGGFASIPFHEESQGTRFLYLLAGPILDILRRGRVLIVDELEASLHPSLLRKIIELFLSNETNKNGAQLIFTTHNTSILNEDLFRRDQIWFVEKDLNDSSTLYPFTDFKVRKDDRFEKAYLTGRFGALPFFLNED